MFLSFFGIFVSFLSFSFFFYSAFFSFFLPLFFAVVFLLLSSPLFHYSRLWPFILSVVTRFTIFIPQPLLAYCGRPSKIAHWSAGCSATTITLCWLHHASFLAKKRFLFCLLPLFIFNTLIQIRVKPLPYLPLWHASTDSSSCLLLLGEIWFQQDISPQKSLSKNPKIGSPISPLPGHTFSYFWPMAHLPYIGWVQVGGAWALCACSSFV